MGRVPLWDVVEAELFALRSWLSDPRELRRTPLRYQRLPGVARDDVPGWAEFVANASADALCRQVGIVAIEKAKLFARHGAVPGMLRAVGRAVVFARWPDHVLLDFVHSQHDSPSVHFGVQVNQPVVRVAPAVVTPDGGLHIPDAGISPAGPIDMGKVPERVRVY